jgi:type I restriction enzyme S subunit
MTSTETKNTKAFYNTEIPNDWKMKKLGEISEIKTGDKDTQNKTDDGLYPFFVRSDNVERINSFSYDGEAILTSGDGVGVGKNYHYINGKFDFHQRVYSIRKFDIEVYGKFIYYYFSEKFYERVQKLSAKNSVDSVRMEMIFDMKIPLPSLPEQKAIAQVLSTADAAIHTTEKLIAQKELRKKWLMQQLLTGKKRLKGFDGEWKEIHIRDVAKEVSIRNKSDKQLTVLSCTKYDGLVPSLEYFGRKIFADDVSTYKIVSKNHFAYATNHIEEGSIGYQEILDEALISPMYTVFKTDKTVNDNFFFKLLKSHPLVYQYQNRMEGSIDRRGGLRWDGFSIIKIKLPLYEEQTAIAQVLQAVDKEISLLKAKAERLREQKKGLMQVLLTGKVRLKINNT